MQTSDGKRDPMSPHRLTPHPAHQRIPVSHWDALGHDRRRRRMMGAFRPLTLSAIDFAPRCEGLE
jgi:hypothetical protein